MATAILLFGSISLKAADDDVEPPKKEAQANGPHQWDEAIFYVNLFKWPLNSKEKGSTHIETKLNLQLDELNRVCGLSDAQRQKLKIAANFAIKRFFEEADVIRKKMQQGQIDNFALAQNWREFESLQIKLKFLFGETSFFSKAVRKTLNPDQIAKYDSIVNERRHFRYRASIEVALTQMECWSWRRGSAPLRAAQHEAIVQLILENTQPPPAFGEYDIYVVMYHLTQLPESKLKPLLEEQQWQQMQAEIVQHQPIIQILIQNGLIPKDDIAETQETQK